MLDICVRSFDFDLRSAGSGGRTLEGYAAVFGAPARIRDLKGDFDEVILPGAFARSLTQRTPILQWDHGKDPAVGTVPIGAFDDIREDDHGLYVRAQLFDHPAVDRVRQAIAGRAVTGMSFRFGVPDGGDTWSRQDSGVELREIRDADVHECGPVAFPAYDTTAVSVRSLLAQLDPDEHRALLRELACQLRDLPDLTVEPAARSAGGGDLDVRPRIGTASPTSTEDLRLQEQALRALGVL